MKREDSAHLTSFLSTVRRFIPKPLFHFFQPYYHYLLSFFGALTSGFPAKKLNITLVTGTKGKTTTTEILYKLLSADGKKVALLNGIHFIIGNTETKNTFKMTVPGRMFVQKFLKRALREGCTHVVCEMTSEGARFYRHAFTYPNTVIYTRIAEEHIESHGSFKAYIGSKARLRDALEGSSKPNRTLILNKDDQFHLCFLPSWKDSPIRTAFYSPSALQYKTTKKATYIKDRGFSYTTILKGEGNRENIAAILEVARQFSLSPSLVEKVLKSLPPISGRGEEITVKGKKGITVVVDYAHTPESLTQLYETYTGHVRVCVLGATGGGRDRKKRKVLGKIASAHCDHIILTDEDPYDENPLSIVEEVREGIHTSHEIILDRREAIQKALKWAKQRVRDRKSVFVLCTGKGTDPYIMRKEGVREPWDEAAVVREEVDAL